MDFTLKFTVTVSSCLTSTFWHGSPSPVSEFVDSRFLVDQLPFFDTLTLVSPTHKGFSLYPMTMQSVHATMISSLYSIMERRSSDPVSLAGDCSLTSQSIHSKPSCSPALLFDLSS